MTFFLPIIAVLVGFLISLVFKPGVSFGLKLLLSFSGAFLLSTTVLEFLPELYNHSSDAHNTGIFIIAGLIFQLLLEFMSRGAEHGHIHIDARINSIPWVLLVSLSLHSLLEGFPLNANNDLLYGVVIHKVPIAVIISSFLLVSHMSKWKCLVFLIIFAMMTPLGSYLATMQFWPELWKLRINAMVVGALLHISTTILFESSQNHRFNSFKFLSIIFGIVLAYLV